LVFHLRNPNNGLRSGLGSEFIEKESNDKKYVAGI
jgi:hypothetical protein